MHSTYKPKSQAEQDEEAAEALRTRPERVDLHARNLGDKEAEDRVTAISNIPKAATSVKRVDLSENLLARLPQHILAFRHCGAVYARENIISTLTTSPHLFAMTWLRELHLARDHFPSEVSQFVPGDDANTPQADNQLTAVPQEIDRLQQLTTLDLEVSSCLICICSFK